MIVDPLENMSVSSQCYDVQRKSYITYSNGATMAWLNAFFNGKEHPDRVPVTIEMAWDILNGDIPRDEWLNRFFPKQMAICQKAIEESRMRLLGF